MPSIAFDANVYNKWIDAFTKTIPYFAVTKTVSNNSGDETLTYAASANISGAFFKRGQNYNLEKAGLFENADAIFCSKTGVFLNKNDKITFNSENFIVDNSIKRYFGSTHIYNTATLFRVD